MGLDNTWIYDRTLRGRCSQGSKHVNYIVSTPIGQGIVKYYKILYCPIHNEVDTIVSTIDYVGSVHAIMSSTILISYYYLG